MTDTVPIDSELSAAERTQFEAIAQNIGLSSATAVRMFVRRFNAEGGFPFPVHTPVKRAYDALYDEELAQQLRQQVASFDSGQAKDLAQLDVWLKDKGLVA